MQVNWTNGNGDGRVLIMNTSNAFTTPSSGSDPAVNSSYSGSGEQVVYNGVGNGPISITNLTPNSTYWFRVYEFCLPDRIYQNATNVNNPNSEATLTCLSSTHYFRSVSSGNWSSLSTWESSSDEITWSAPNCIPNFNANAIRIGNGTVVTLNNALDVDQIIIENGGVLRKLSGGAMNLIDGSGDDLVIQNGGVLEYAGAVIPTYQNTNVRIRVQTGGRIRVNTATSGISDNLAGSASSNRVIYEDQAIFQYNTSNIFATSNQNYFPNVNSSTIPTFLLTSNIGNIGAGTNTTFNGLFEANGNITFNDSGLKIFRNGIVGNGNLLQTNTCGNFVINGSVAYLGGTGSILLDYAPLIINNNVDAFLISDKTINTSNGNPNIGQMRLLDGSTLDLASFALIGTANILVNSDVTLRTSHPNGLDGALSSLANIDFAAPLNQTLDFYALGAQLAGFILAGECSNIIVGNGTLLELNENLIVNTNLTMNSNATITVTTGETLRLTNPATNAIVGGNLIGASNYIHGRLQRATIDGNDYDFPIGYPGYGAQGFNISVSGSGEILGELETYTTAPIFNYAYCDLGTPTGSGQQIGQGIAALDGILDQITFDINSPLQWHITNPSGAVTAYDLVLSANGMNDIMPVISAGATPIRFTMKNGEPGNPGVAVGNTLEFPQTGFLSCPNGYSLSGLTSFSTFTINGSSAPSTALPVELLFFDAQVNEKNQVNLLWATASELNNDYFTVERSTDGGNWEIVEIVAGSGTTSVRTDYQTLDERPNKGISYYRLKQIDFDGTISYSNIVSVFVDSEDKQIIKITNILGQDVNPNAKGLVIFVFSNGETLKVIND